MENEEKRSNGALKGSLKFKIYPPPRRCNSKNFFDLSEVEKSGGRGGINFLLVTLFFIANLLYPPNLFETEHARPIASRNKKTKKFSFGGNGGGLKNSFGALATSSAIGFAPKLETKININAVC